jgi:hypothetical protein
MTDYNDFLFPEDRDNPSDNEMWIAPKPDDEAIPDPALQVLESVEDALGIQVEDKIILAGDEAPENIRGNRYTSVIDALIDLFLAGILAFANVIFLDDEIGIEVDDNS